MTTTKATISFGHHYANAYVRLYASKLTGSQAVIPIAPIANAEKWGLNSDGFAQVGDGLLDVNGKLTFVWEEAEHDPGTLQAAVRLVDGWRLSDPVAYGDPPVPPDPHPFLGTGFEWLHFENLSKLWDDESATDPAEGTEGEEVRRYDLVEGTTGRYMYNQSTGNRFLYSPVTNAIDGKPTIYTRQNSSSFDVRMKLAAVAVGASTFLSGRAFTLAVVARNVSTINNQRLFAVGLNRPMNSQWLNGNVLRSFGFVTSFVTADTSSWSAGSVRFLQFRWNDSTTELEVRINGGSWVSSAGGDAGWSPDTGAISMISGNMDIVTWGVFNGYKLDADMTDLYNAMLEYYPSLGS